MSADPKPITSNPQAVGAEQRSGGAHAAGGGYYEFLRKLYGPGPGAEPRRSVLGSDVNWLLELGPVPLELDASRRAQVDPHTLPLMGNAETHLMARSWTAARSHDLVDLSLRLPSLAIADPSGETLTTCAELLLEFE